MNIKAGDKVKIIEDVKDCDTIKKGDIIEIDRVRGDIFYVKDHKLNDTEAQFFLFESEFELVEEDKKYVWYLDDEEVTHYLCNYNGIKKIKSVNKKQGRKDGEEGIYLLTEEQAKQSPFFDKFKKHDPFEEKLYYIRMKNSDGKFLNSITDEGEYFMGTDIVFDSYKTKFTEKECEEIIGTSSILYKELVNEK